MDIRSETLPAKQIVDKQESLAPWWHTFILIAYILGTSWMTAQNLHSGRPLRARASEYIVTMIFQWITIVYLWFGLHLRGRSLRDVIGKSWHSIEDGLLDFAIAAGFWIGSIAVLAGVQYVVAYISHTDVRATAQSRFGDLAFIAPQSLRELALFYGVAITAGICEEIIFRGYLQRQFVAWTRNSVLGIIASALLFGLAHGYQGFKTMIVLACYGALFGTLAYVRRSIVPGMIAHAWQDSLSGTILFFIVKHPNLLRLAK